MPGAPDPLTFRLFETIGERLPTAALPRAFAHADLRDVAGWKAQIEAAERGVELSDPDARERIYGMPYDDWKARHQKGPKLDHKGTPES